MISIPRFILFCLIFLFLSTACSEKEGKESESKTFAGVWNSNWGVIRLTQDENKVYGTYDNAGIPGYLEGNVIDSFFYFEWWEEFNGSDFRNTSVYGGGEFRLSQERDALIGRWWYANTTDWQSNATINWTATRLE